MSDHSRPYRVPVSVVEGGRYAAAPALALSLLCLEGSRPSVAHRLLICEGLRAHREGASLPSLSRAELVPVIEGRAWLRLGALAPVVSAVAELEGLALSATLSALIELGASVLCEREGVRV